MKLRHVQKDIEKIKFLKKIEKVEVKERKNQNILHYQKDKIDQMQFYGYVKMLPI